MKCILAKTSAELQSNSHPKSKRGKTEQKTEPHEFGKVTKVGTKSSGMVSLVQREVKQHRI